MLPTTLLLADPALAAPRVGRRVHVRRPRALPLRRGWAALAVLGVLVAGALGYLRMWPPLATVMSASMEPTIRTGDMVVLKRLDGPAHVGQVVSVSVPDEARSRYGYPPVVIHRVLAVARDGSVTTKGDARKDPDPFKSPRTALTATVVGKLPAGGRVVAFLSSGMGLTWLASGVLLLLAMPLLDRQRDARESESGELRAQLATISEELAALRHDRLVLAELQAATATLSDRLQPIPAAPPEPGPLERLAETLPPLPVADHSAPQLAFALDVERRPRFARPREPELDPAPMRKGQLVLALAAPQPPWDTPPPELRRFSGLIAASHFQR